MSLFLVMITLVPVYTTGGSFSMATSGQSPAPAPAPPVNAWDKPISLAVTTTSMSLPVDSKFDKNDQHDSGIDVSEPLNSAGSSTRSSPSGEKKVRTGDLINKVRVVLLTLLHCWKNVYNNHLYLVMCLMVIVFILRYFRN